MSKLLESLKDLSHHAYCLIGGDSSGNDTVHEELVSALKNSHKIITQGNPDFIDRHYQTFTIDEAREVKALHDTRPVSDKKIIILTTNGITVEAQNALLKLLEEPAEYAHFFLIISSAHLLLPTVKSRMLMIRHFEKLAPDDLSAQFLKSPISKRLEIIKKLMDSISDEKRPKQDAIDLLNSLESTLYAKVGAQKGFKQLEAIGLAKTYANDRSPSLKMLLEYVALNI